MSLKVKSKKLGHKLNELQDGLLSHYRRAELQNLRIVVC
jgi:hypothetical protein